MMFAAKNELYQSLQALIAQNQQSINEQDNNCMTILHHILLQEDTKMAKKLVRRGADVNHIDKNGNSLLIKLVKLNKEKAVQFLIEKGALLHLVDGEGNDACHYANQNGLAEKLPVFQSCSPQKKAADKTRLLRGDFTGL